MLPGWGRLFVADVLQGGEDAAVDAEIGELHAFFFGFLSLGCGCGRRLFSLGFGGLFGLGRGGLCCGGNGLSEFDGRGVGSRRFGLDGVVVIFGHREVSSSIGARRHNPR